MADNEKGEDDNFVLIAGLSLIGIVVSVFLILLVVLYSVLSFIPLVDWDGNERQFDCTRMEELDEEYSVYVNETWVKSDEIEEYEDIPEEQRRDLSEGAKRYLRDSARVDYTSRHYQNLPEKEKQLFMKAIESDSAIEVKSYPNKSVILPKYVNLSSHDVIYNNTTYECLEFWEDDPWA